MSMFDAPLPVNPAGLWEMNEEPHELIFKDHVMRGFDHHLCFDYHLPICKRGTHDLIDDLDTFLGDLTKDVSTGDLPTPTLTHEQEKWLALSGMQKAVRRGDFLATWKACYGLHAYGAGGAMWRRLAIITLEDIGPGDPYLIALCLRAMTKKVREQFNEFVLLRVILERACKAPKSRDLCDVATWCFMEDGVMNKLGAEYCRDLTSLDNMMEARAQLIAFAANTDFNFNTRLAALWGISGKWHDPSKLGVPPLPPAVPEVCDAMQLPPLFRYIALNATKLGDPMPLVLPFVWQMVCASPWTNTVPDLYSNYQDSVMVGDFYAASLDKHTWKGSAALKKFAHHLPIKNWLGAHPHVNKAESLKRAVFYVEGGLLNPRLIYDGEIKLYETILGDKMLCNGHASYTEGLAFYELVGQNLKALHDCRGIK